MKNGENPEVCSALTLKGLPCKKAGTVPLGDGTHLCGAHASAALRASEAGPKVTKNAPARPAEVKPAPESTPGPKWAAAKPSGPFSANTIRRQLDRLERRDRKAENRFQAVRADVAREAYFRGEPTAPEVLETATLRETRFRILNTPSRYARPEAVPADHYGTPEGAAEIEAFRTASAASYRLEINGERGEVLYADHASASEAARELSRTKFRGAVIYVETVRGTPSGAYHLGRRAA